MLEEEGTGLEVGDSGGGKGQAAGIRIAQRWREASIRHNTNKPEHIMDVNPAAVTAAFRDSGTQLMIHGHTHRPGRHHYQVDGRPCERIVLGDWTETQGWFARIDAAGDVELLPLPLTGSRP